MTVQMHALPFDPAALKGLSERLVVSHHQNNYGGAVKRLNAIRTQLAQVDFSTAPGFTLNGLKREELIAVNSMVLHELYFASLGGDGQPPPPIALALASSFGGEQRWRDEFVAMGKALGGGSGWVILSYQPRDGTLVNQWASDHTQCLAAGLPILALDMYEHAYHIDFGADVSTYVERFMESVNWTAAASRYARAVHAASAGLGATADEAGSALVLDVRRAGVFVNADTLLPGAQWRDPADIAQWMAQMPRDRDILVYCVHGHEVSRNSAIRLRAHGLNARYLEGGIDAWRLAGRPLASRGEAP